MPVNHAMLGFTLLELLVGLLFTALIVLGIAHYFLVSTQVHLIIQQEALAARTLENLLLQAHFNGQSEAAIQNSLPSNNCPNEAFVNGLDFTHWCQALKELPQLNYSLTSVPAYLEWQSPTGIKRIQR